MSYRSKSIRTLTRHHPWSEEVLEWHGMRLDELDPSTSLDTACWLFSVDVDEVVRDLYIADPTCDDVVAWPDWATAAAEDEDEEVLAYAM